MDDVELHRTHSRANERALRLPNPTDQSNEITGSCLAAVVNVELQNRSCSLNINSDFLCPIAQLIPEDAVIFGGKLYERSSAEEFVRDSLTKQLPRSARGRYVKDPLNPSHIIYACENREALTDEAEIFDITDLLIRDVDNEWYAKLKTEVERARATTQITRGSDGKLKFIFTLSNFHRH